MIDCTPGVVSERLSRGIRLTLATGTGYGAEVPSEGGYVARLHEVLQDRYDCLPSARSHPDHGCKQLQLVNLAVGGATTPSLIAGQLPAATSLLEARNHDHNPRNDVEVITLHIGGNDVVGPIVAACIGGPTPSCFETIAAELAAYRDDLDAALSRLRAAAGDRTRIVIGTYDNPVPTCDLAAVPGAVELSALVLEGGPGVPQGLDDIMRDVGADYGVEVAHVYGDLAPQDWLGGSDCLHPDDSGYAKVAAAFAEVLLTG